MSNIQNGTVSKVSFTSSNTSKATVSPANDTLSPYKTTATGVAPGTATITAQGYMGGVAITGCKDTSLITIPTPACTVYLAPVTKSISLGSVATFTATAYPVNGTVDQVNFSSLNTSIATVDPASDSTVPYSTNATGVGVGSTATIKANVIMGGSSRCSDTSTITITPPKGWWQVTGGNIHADTGAVWSRIPDTCTGTCKPYLILNDVSGTTGLVSHNNLVRIDSGAGISEDGNNWQAKSKYQGPTTNYAYFKNILDDDPDGLKEWDGHRPVGNGVFLANPGVTETNSGDSWAFGATRKIVLLVDGEIKITKNITVAEGGFLAIISSGNITLADNVTHVEAVLIADGQINTCETESGCPNQLTGEGIFAGWGDIDLRRDLGAGNDSAPAESFSYRPDLQANAYNYLLKPGYRWQEVNP